MQNIRRSVFAILIMSLAAPVYGCASNAATPPPSGEVPPNVERAFLEIVGSASRAVPEFDEERIEIRYVDQDGAAIADSVVDFAIEGDSRGATLSGSAAATDANGIASVVVRAGGSVVFDVVASAPLADPAVVTIDVEQMRFGTLDYTVTYAGRRLVRDAEVALFTNTSCDALNTRVPTPRDVSYPRIGETKQFGDVEVGRNMAVYALGIDRNDQVAAEACADVVLDTTTGSVTIALEDVSELFGGRYEVVESFDVTEGLPTALDMTLRILHGLADDPASFVVEFVRDLDSVPGWVESVLDFGPSRAVVIGLLRDVLSRVHLPGYVTELLDLGRDLDIALADMTLAGELEFPEPNEFGEGMGTHSLRSMRVPVDGMIVERNISATTEVQIQVASTITLPEHSLDVSFGQLVEIILNDVLLPRLPGSPDNLGDLVSGLLDCRAIADSLAGDSSTTASVVNSVCELGSTFIGAYLEDQITSLWSFETLNLQGTADLEDTDGDYDRDVIRNGMSTARWTGDSGELVFNGDMNGTRLDDRPRAHPIRDRMTELR